MRVVQRNLVYVVGLALELCYEDLLKGPDYFGQFGKIVKVIICPCCMYGLCKSPAQFPRCLTLHVLSG